VSPAHALGEFHGAAHLGARLVLLGAAALASLLGRLQLAWRDLEARTWWASNGRDVLLLFSVAVQSLALCELGFSTPAALLVAAQLTLLDVLVEVALFSAHHVPAQNAAAVAIAVGVALVPACAPEQTFAVIDRFAALLLG
jgi:hypothetical protein